MLASTETNSQSEIRRWSEIIVRDQVNGIDRLRNYICSMALGRKFGQSMEVHIAERELTEFVAWARKLTQPGTNKA